MFLIVGVGGSETPFLVWQFSALELNYQICLWPAHFLREGLKLHTKTTYLVWNGRACVDGLCVCMCVFMSALFHLQTDTVQSFIKERDQRA